MILSTKAIGGFLIADAAICMLSTAAVLFADGIVVDGVLSDDVTPNLAADDLADDGPSDRKFYGKFPLTDAATGVPYADLTDGFICEFGAAMTFPTHQPALYGRIVHVVGVRAKEKVCRVDAERVVSAWAVVANLHAIRDRSVSEFPTDAMGKKILPTDRASDDAVPIRKACASPEYTSSFGRLAEAIGEGDCNGDVCSSRLTHSGTESNIESLYPCWVGEKLLPAHVAGHGDSGCLRAVAASTRAELAAPVLDFAGTEKERLSTDTADAGDFRRLTGRHGHPPRKGGCVQSGPAVASCWSARFIV